LKRTASKDLSKTKVLKSQQQINEQILCFGNHEKGVLLSDQNLPFKILLFDNYCKTLIFLVNLIFTNFASSIKSRN